MAICVPLSARASWRSPPRLFAVAEFECEPGETDGGDENGRRHDLQKKFVDERNRQSAIANRQEGENLEVDDGARALGERGKIRGPRQLVRHRKGRQDLQPRNRD